MAWCSHSRLSCGNRRSCCFIRSCGFASRSNRAFSRISPGCLSSFSCVNRLSLSLPQRRHGAVAVDTLSLSHRGQYHTSIQLCDTDMLLLLVSTPALPSVREVGTARSRAPRFFGVLSNEAEYVNLKIPISASETVVGIKTRLQRSGFRRGG